MIDHMYVSIALAAVSLATGLIVVSSNMKLWRKIIVASLICFSSVVSYRAMFHFYGYPAPLKKSFEEVLVLGFKADIGKGVIYLWLQESNKEPRAYVTPYSSALHKALIKMRRSNRGAPFKVKMKTETSMRGSYRGDGDKVKIKGVPIFPPKGPQWEEDIRL